MAAGARRAMNRAIPRVGWPVQPGEWLVVAGAAPGSRRWPGGGHELVFRNPLRPSFIIGLHIQPRSAMCKPDTIIT